MAAPPVTPFLLGLVAGPLVFKGAKPLLRGAVKTVMALGHEVRRLACRVGEEIEDIVAETAAETITDQGRCAPPHATH